MDMPDRRRITVVNDNESFLEMMREALQDRYTVVTFNGTNLVPGRLAASRPDLLIIDLVMRGRELSGWEVVEAARNDERLAEVPIIVCSADREQLRAREAELSAMPQVTVLVKPFGLSELDAAVAAALDSRAGTDRAAG